MPYIGKSPSAGVRQRYQYTATAGQTTFSGTDLGNLTLTYTDNNFVDVFQNGVLLKGGGTDYTATSGTSVVLATGASVSDVIEIIVYDVFSVGNFYNRTDSDSRYQTTLAGIDDQSSSNDDQITITDSTVVINEDSDDMEKQNTLNDIFMALEQLNTEVDELDALDSDMDSTGVGDLNDQLTTFRKHIGALYQVLDRAGRIVPMESVNEAVDQALIDSVVDQIMRDIKMGDQTAIEELLMSCPEDKLKGFLSDVEESKQSQDLAHLKKLAGIEENVDQQYADVLATKNQIKINAFLQNLDPKTATRLTGGKAQTSRISKDGQSFLPSGDPYVHGKP